MKTILEQWKMEFIGTFLLNFFVGMASVQFSLDHISEMAYGLSCFTIYCLLLWIAQNVSKSQFNPAISLFLMISGHINLLEGLTFTLVQIIASIFSMGVIKFIIPYDLMLKLEETSLIGFPLVSLNIFSAIILEAIATFFLVFGYYILVIERKTPKYVYAPGIAGIFYFTSVKMLDKTGSCFNPARFIGLSLIGNFYHNFYIFIIGPLLGGILGSLLANLMLSERPTPIGFKNLKNKIKTIPIDQSQQIIDKDE